MQPNQQNNEESSGSLAESSSFSPILANTLKSNAPDIYMFVSYCQKQNMIIVCCSDFTLKFYNATTLLPLEERKQKLDEYVTDMKYSDKTDTFLLLCYLGSIYSYKTSSNELKKLKGNETYAFSAELLSDSFYAFSLLKPRELHIGSLDNDNVYKFDHQNNYSQSLCYLPKSNLLLSDLLNGSLRIYRTNKLPQIRVFCSIRAHEKDFSGLKIQKMTIGKKEYVVTSSRKDQTVKIWHLIRGRMRLLRVIHIGGDVGSLVFLENYKMIAVACEKSNEIKFFNVFSGKLEKTFVFSEGQITRLFLMKDKNMIGGIGGVPDSFHDTIEFIQLHPQA